MCGIIGYSGRNPACDILLTALSNLEYRGYDSAGIALWKQNGIEVIREEGRLAKLISKAGEKPQESTCGIGHTRWATHGRPTQTNAHPHRSGRVTLVHNGIIENYLELKAMLSAKGYTFATQTDSEIAAALIDSLYTNNPLAAIHQALGMLEGSYAFAILFDGEPGTVYGVRHGSPLIAAADEQGSYLASDLPAILDYTNRYLLLEEGELVRVSGGALELYDKELHPISRPLKTAGWSVDAARKDGYEYFMLKEIDEQPKAILNTISPRIKNGVPNFGEELPKGFFKDIKKINITACGTALYAGQIGKALIERTARIPVEIDIASELRYRNPIIGEQEAAIIISQSGETADSLAALRLYKQRGVPVIAVVNVVGSSIAREADYCLYTYAGPEIAVASTKAYSVQVAMMHLISILAAADKGMPLSEQQEATAKLKQVVELIPTVLAMAPQLKDYAATLTDADSLFYIGRGLDYSLAMEGSLKLKEISYIHSDAYAAGELKHGTISLIVEGTPVIALATQPELLPKTVSNIKEVKARGASVLVITQEGLSIDPDAYDHILRLPACDPTIAPLLAVVTLQLIAANAAILRGCDVDKPRNLAKSVTVE